MENFAPGLRETIVSLADSLRFVVFFVCVAGFVLQVQRARAEMEELMRPIVRAIVIVGLIGALPYWFGFSEKVFLHLADAVCEGYTQHPMQTAAKLRDSVADANTEFSLRRVGESMYKAFLYGSAKLVVLIGSLLQLPFLVLQYLLKLLCYLFLPVALGLMMIPSLASTGTRYVQQTLAVLSWPVGFAVTELVAYHLLTAYGSNLATAYGLQPGEIDAASFASLLGALLAALWLLIGTLGTPVLMQMLICSGAPISAGGQTALQQLYMVQQLAWMLKTVKSGGIAAPLAATASSGGKGAAGGLPPSLPPPPPPAPVTPPPAPAPAPAPRDPSGDAQVSAALAATRLPAAHVTP